MSQLRAVEPADPVTVVFMECWQHECCGEPFAVGDAVIWPVVALEGDSLVELLGEDLGCQLRRAVQRHEQEVQALSGTVTAIQAVLHRRERVPAHPDGRHHRAQPGSAVLRTLEAAARRESCDDLEWAGDVVALLEDA